LSLPDPSLPLDIDERGHHVPRHEIQMKWCAFLFAHKIYAVIGGNLEKPGTEGKIGCILLDTFKGLSKCFYGKIFSITGIINHFKEHKIYCIAVPAKQFRISPLVAIPVAFNTRS
jgi:hypothetical protein